MGNARILFIRTHPVRRRKRSFSQIENQTNGSRPFHLIFTEVWSRQWGSLQFLTSTHKPPQITPTLENFKKWGNLKHGFCQNYCQENSMILKKLLLLVLGFTLSGCNSEYRMILEFQDVNDFKIEKIRDSDGEIILVSGFAFHSSLACDKLILNDTGTEINAQIVLVPVQKGKTGDFNYKVRISEKTEKITFGKNRHVIWKR
jgi:hypothetical protein